MALTMESPHAAILWFMLLMQADDNGVFEWKVLTLKARCLPAVNSDINQLLAALVQFRFIQRFEHGGAVYGAVRNFRRFQRPKKPKALYPLPNELRTFVGTEAVGSPLDEDEDHTREDCDQQQPEPVPNRFPTELLQGDPVPHQFPTSPEPVGESLRRGEEGGGKDVGKKEDSCPKPGKPVRTKHAYPSDYEEFWRAYPTSLTMSKLEACKAWEKLGLDDRVAAMGSIPGFLAYCRTHPTYTPVHACRYLAQRRFDGDGKAEAPEARHHELYDRGL